MQVIARFVPFVFGLIGVTVIYFLWFGMDGGSGSPPVFFKIFGSLIGSVFCVVGFGAAILGPQKARIGTRRGRTKARRRAQRTGDDGYTCPHCQGGLEARVDVSPSGDVKCAFCDRWFNIHGAG